MIALKVKAAECQAYNYAEDFVHERIPEADVERMLRGAGLMLGGGFKSFGGFVLALAGIAIFYTGIGVAGAGAGIFVAGAGASDMNQGAEEFFLGMSGDSTTLTSNGMSDLFYDGNNGIYHLSTGTAALAGSVLTPYVNGAAEQVLLTEATATESATIEKSAGTADDVLLAEEGADVAQNLKPQNLMEELADSGVKYNPDEVLAVTKTSDGKLLWLEQGNSKSGLTHILERHADDFASQGIDNIPQLLNDVLKTTPIKVGSNSKGLFADYVFNGNTYRIAYGNNGYIVSFYPID